MVLAPAGPLAGQPLLLVALDRLRVANLRCVRILAGVAQRTPLPEQVPALVEAHLDLLEPVVLVRAEPALADLRVELVLLVDEPLDPVVNLFVCHHTSLRATPEDGTAE